MLHCRSLVDTYSRTCFYSGWARRRHVHTFSEWRRLSLPDSQSVGVCGPCWDGDCLHQFKLAFHALTELSRTRRSRGDYVLISPSSWHTHVQQHVPRVLWQALCIPGLLNGPVCSVTAPGPHQQQSPAWGTWQCTCCITTEYLPQMYSGRGFRAVFNFALTEHWQGMCSTSSLSI